MYNQGNNGCHGCTREGSAERVYRCTREGSAGRVYRAIYPPASHGALYVQGPSRCWSWLVFVADPACTVARCGKCQLNVKPALEHGCHRAGLTLSLSVNFKPDWSGVLAKIVNIALSDPGPPRVIFCPTLNNPGYHFCPDPLKPPSATASLRQKNTAKAVTFRPRSSRPRLRHLESGPFTSPRFLRAGSPEVDKVG